MELTMWMWEWYKTIVGAVSLSIIVLVVVGLITYYLWWRYTRVKCLDCGGYKFEVMVGGPPRCIKCGWQRTKFSDNETDPNSKKRDYYTVNW